MLLFKTRFGNGILPLLFRGQLHQRWPITQRVVHGLPTAPTGFAGHDLFCRPGASFPAPTSLVAHFLAGLAAQRQQPSAAHVRRHVAGAVPQSVWPRLPSAHERLCRGSPHETTTQSCRAACRFASACNSLLQDRLDQSELDRSRPILAVPQHLPSMGAWSLSGRLRISAVHGGHKLLGDGINADPTTLSMPPWLPVLGPASPFVILESRDEEDVERLPSTGG